MTITTTITQDTSQFQPLVLHLHVQPPEHRITLFSIAEKLMNIVLLHQKESDPLSKKLFMQGSALSLYVFNNFTQDLSGEILWTHFIGLKNLIAKECCSDHVEAIWLTGAKAWEKRELDLYCKAFSKYQGHSIHPLDLGVPHEFGQEVVNWIKELENQIPVLAELEAYQQKLVSPPCEITVNEMGVPVVIGLQEPDLITELVIANPDELDSRNANRVLNEFNRRMDSLIYERNQIILVEDLKKQNSFMSKTVDQFQKTFKDELSSLVNSNQQQISYLTGKLNSTIALNKDTIKEYKETTEMLDSAYKRCQTEIARQAAELTDCKNQISSLKQSNHHLMCRVNGLQNEVDNMDSGCVIS